MLRVEEKKNWRRRKKEIPPVVRRPTCKRCTKTLAPSTSRTRVLLSHGAWKKEGRVSSKSDKWNKNWKGLLCPGKNKKLCCAKAFSEAASAVTLLKKAYQWKKVREIVLTTLTREGPCQWAKGRLGVRRPSVLKKKGGKEIGETERERGSERERSPPKQNGLSISRLPPPPGASLW